MSFGNVLVVYLTFSPMLQKTQGGSALCRMRPGDGGLLDELKEAARGADAQRGDGSPPGKA